MAAAFSLSSSSACFLAYASAFGPKHRRRAKIEFALQTFLAFLIGGFQILSRGGLIDLRAFHCSDLQAVCGVQSSGHSVSQSFSIVSPTVFRSMRVPGQKKGIWQELGLPFSSDRPQFLPHAALLLSLILLDDVQNECGPSIGDIGLFRQVIMHVVMPRCGIILIGMRQQQLA